MAIMYYIITNSYSIEMSFTA